MRERHETAGEVAFLLEPDLKEGRGGLRDVHALRWAEAARQPPVGGRRPRPRGRLRRAPLRPGRAAPPHGPARRPAAARGAGRRGRGPRRGVGRRPDAHPGRRRPHDRLAQRRRLAAHRRVAARPLGLAVAGATGRSAPASCCATARSTSPPRPIPPPTRAWCSGPPRPPRPGTRGSTAARSTGWPPRPVPLPTPWPDDVRRALVDLLLAGHRAIPVVEALDQMGLWVHVLPEWEAVRSKPQRNAYHRFTVDRHLMEACANAAALVARTDRPDLLVLGALLHDIGKGYPGDHTEVGIELVATIGARMGLPPADVDVLVVDGAPPPAAARRRDPPRPRRPRHHRGGGRGRRRPAHPRAARRPHRGRQRGHRTGGVGHVEGRPRPRPGGAHHPRAGRRLRRGGA